MKNKSRKRLLPIFFLFLFLAVSNFFLSETGTNKVITGFFEQLFNPVQTFIVTLVRPTNTTTTEATLRAENIHLQTLLAQQEHIQQDNEALRDQFALSTPAPKSLLPTEIIGLGTDDIIVDKGSADGVHVGDVLVFKDTVVGKLFTVSVHRSIGHLITSEDISLTAKTAKTAALGIVKGKSADKVELSNVVLSDKLEKNDLVVTKGDLDQNNNGFPPDLVIGKIGAVNKKSSELFQSAEVVPLIDVKTLTMVFILKN